MTINFGILAGVSSDAQVEDKASIPDQIKTCRAAIEQLNGREVACYIMDGYSRTGYDSLADAMEDIPPLKEAIEGAASNEYDVLILDNWDRLGDLGQLVHTRFNKYRKQIYSARQSGRLYDPATYNPYMDESAGIDMHVQAILQQYRINKLRRGWSVGVPKRVDDGLSLFGIPDGYTRVDKKTPPIKNARAIYMVMIKDWFLEGRPVLWICQELDRLGVKPPKGKQWNPSSINHILLNPFYAGIIALGQKRLDPGKKKKLYMQRAPMSEWKQNRGRHEPLWNEETYLAIQNEFARRQRLRNYAKALYPLAGLLRCAECKQKLIRRRGTRKGIPTAAIACNRGHAHVVLYYDEAIQLLADEIKAELNRLKQDPTKPHEEEQRIQCKIEEYQAQIERVQDGYKVGIYKKEQAAEEIKELERLEGTERTRLEQLRRTQQTRLQFRALANRLAQLDELGKWMATEDPVLINQTLSTLCKTVWVTPEHQLIIEWRE